VALAEVPVTEVLIFIASDFEVLVPETFTEGPTLLLD
jgi:hypothetical protein